SRRGRKSDKQTEPQEVEIGGSGRALSPGLPQRGECMTKRTQIQFATGEHESSDALMRSSGRKEPKWVGIISWPHRGRHLILAAKDFCEILKNGELF
ncbi:MAG TPA: hypothetical protein VLA17_01215, partial [Candidatus Limnocylindria bacterium]|nr:hypothetical protein [Candidatus Limnocylindria bacterium]